MWRRKRPYAAASAISSTVGFGTHGGQLEGTPLGTCRGEKDGRWAVPGIVKVRPELD
jgi:hypothetical protein